MKNAKQEIEQALNLNEKPLKLSEYNNYDVRYGVPENYIHVSIARVSFWAKKAKIEFYQAFSGFKKSGKYFKPIMSGIIIRTKDFDELALAMKENHKSEMDQIRSNLKKLQETA